MRSSRMLFARAIPLAFLAGVQADAQVAPESTRFTVTAAPILSQPQAEFRQNVGRGFGGGGALLYDLDRPGFFSLRFDVSSVAYGRETRRGPISERIGERVLVDVTTTNSITALSFGPELALPKGAVRPYLNAGFSELFFRTTSSVKGTNTSDDSIAKTTNYSDGTGGWFLGGGLRIPFGNSRSRKAISLDVGIRYHHGGVASYLREGSIWDNPDGSISVSPLNSRTPYAVYLIGIRYRIPHNASKPCQRFLC